MYQKFLDSNSMVHALDGVLYQKTQERQFKKKQESRAEIYYTENQLANIESYEEFKTHKNLVIKLVHDENKTVDWLRDNDFIAAEGSLCPGCLKLNRKKIGRMHYHKIANTGQRRKAGYIIKCRGGSNGCRLVRTPFAGSFFDGVTCKLPVGDVLEAIYYWSRKTSVKNTAYELGCEEKTIVDYFSYLREVCTVSLMERGENIIGGPGLTVEIDESKFFKNKYGKGRAAIDQKKGWVFGGICRETKEFFMVRVPDRTKKTLLPIIHRHVKPGTTIMSDEWKAYYDLQMTYEHKTICHKRNFVAPDNAYIHTQHVENLWRYAKKNLPQNSTSEDMKDSYLHEYMYRKKHEKNLIDSILHDIKTLYNWRDGLYAA